MVASKIFEADAERYDCWYREHREIFECEVKAVKALGLKGRGLSIGVGTGILDVQAGLKFGVDPALAMLKLAAARKIESIQSVGEYLPFKDEIFNFALMTVTFCFLNSPEDVLTEIGRVLRRRGVLATCIVTRESTWGRAYMRKAREGHLFYRHAHFYTTEELKEKLRKHSFKVVSIKTTLSYPPSALPRIEEPMDFPDGRGFVCVKAVKIDTS